MAVEPDADGTAQHQRACTQLGAGSGPVAAQHDRDQLAGPGVTARTVLHLGLAQDEFGIVALGRRGILQDVSRRLQLVAKQRGLRPLQALGQAQVEPVAAVGAAERGQQPAGRLVRRLDQIGMFGSCAAGQPLRIGGVQLHPPAVSATARQAGDDPSPANDPPQHMVNITGAVLPVQQRHHALAGSNRQAIAPQAVAEEIHQPQPGPGSLPVPRHLGRQHDHRLYALAHGRGGAHLAAFRCCPPDTRGKRQGKRGQARQDPALAPHRAGDRRGWRRDCFVRRRHPCSRLQHFRFRHPAESEARHRADHALFLAIVAHGAPGPQHDLAQLGIRHVVTAEHRHRQLIAPDRTVPVLDQVLQAFQHPRGHRHRAAKQTQLARAAIQQVIGKAVGVGHWHGGACTRRHRFGGTRGRPKYDRWRRCFRDHPQRWPARTTVR